ncbi:MAG: low molecular weight protein-tyrosine-phosphatase [Planctomycetota bacterium]
MPEPPTNSVLFVCLGNICRSPLAEGIFLHLARERAIDVVADSAGTGHWHVGDRPDRRALATADRHGVELPGIGRQIDPSSDFGRFAWIVPMDASNHRDLLRLGSPPERTRRMRAFDPEHAGEVDRAPDVPDPYYGEDDGFERVYEMLTAACNGLLDQLVDQRHATANR